MRARAVNQHYLGQNTLRDLDAEYAAGGAANQSHAPRAAKCCKQALAPVCAFVSPFFEGRRDDKWLVENCWSSAAQRREHRPVTVSPADLRVASRRDGSFPPEQTWQKYPFRHSHWTNHRLRIDSDDNDKAFAGSAGRHRLSPALPENRHRQVQRLLHRARSQIDPRRNGRIAGVRIEHRPTAQRDQCGEECDPRGLRLPSDHKEIVRGIRSLVPALDGRLGWTQEHLVRAARREVWFIRQRQSGSRLVASGVRE